MGLFQESLCITAISVMTQWSLKCSVVPQLGSPQALGKWEDVFYLWLML